MVFWGGNTLRPGERWYFAGENVVLGGVNLSVWGRKQISVERSGLLWEKAWDLG